MPEIFLKAITISRKQWPLLLFFVSLSILFQIDFGLSDENFGFSLLLGIPYFFWLIFTYVIVKLIDHKLEHPKTTLKESLIMYLNLAPKVILPMLGLMIILAMIMTIVITMVYGIFNLLGIENSKSIFDSGPRDLNFIIFSLLLNIALAFFNFQPIFYFIKKVPFFPALKSSVIFAKEHLVFTLGIAFIYFVITMISAIVLTDTWFDGLVTGLLSGLQYYYFSIVFILFYRKVS